ncbi:MAG: glycosyl hydrolase, partial [Gemmatimonadaceae bacterium]|nr:glycosyl hydrolase [Gemmatimonadaceae bacterium]
MIAVRSLLPLAVVAGLCVSTLSTPVSAQTPAQPPARRPAAGPRPVAPPPEDFAVGDGQLAAALRWRHIGPVRGGRVTTVTGVRQEPFTFYFGSTGGGVWKTTDAGQTWRNVSDGAFACASMGSLDVADSDPGVVWAGTGSDGIRSNISIGCGVYVSRDAGATWRSTGLADVGQIGAVVVHPTNPDMVWVAAMGDPFKPTRARGVYRTADGGRTWSKTLYVSDSTGAVDLELKPDDPTTVYAVMWRGERKPWAIISGAREGGVYKSTDGGLTWAKLAGGLPTGLWGKGDLAVSPANPNRVYLLLEATPGQGLWRSDDAGATWTLVNTTVALLNRPFYYTNVDADPTNADVVYVNNEGFFRSIDGGKSFRTRPTPHGDNHDMWINPSDPRIIVQSNDGGANVTLNGGDTWTTQYNQPTAEVYQVAVDQQWPYRVYGAQQDQGQTHVVPSLPLTSSMPDDPMMQWQPVGGCETGPAVPSRLDPDVVYAACKGQFSRFNRRTGQEQHYWVGAQFMYGHDPKDLKERFQRVSPIHVSPHDP